MTGKLVSIIIPVYNCEKYIGKCLESVLGQTYKNVEIIVIDDGSTDQSLEVINRTVQGNPNVKVIHQENQGLSATRNKGLENATGDYIAFLDGDDYLGESYIERLIAAAEHNNSDLAICGYQKVDAQGVLLSKTVPGQYIPFEHEEWAYRIIISCARLYKKEIWNKYHMTFEIGAHGEDVPLSLFFNKVCKNIVTVPAAEYYYVQHSESITHNFRGLRNRQLPYRSIEKILEQAEQIPEGNSQDFLELGMMRFLTQCVFDLGRGASKDQLHELCDFTYKIMERYFPNYWKNKKSSMWSNLDIPFINKVEVKIFMVLLKLHLLYPAARIL
ncbi:MAG: glycosyltransferase family 2 protein [Lachnospiraceae bacterium]|nr:glycosyltransferase family 2 protein [Lachnospiraceae bacterium]